jgi:hypothetical protein
MTDVVSFVAELEKLAEELFTSANIWRQNQEVLSPKVIAVCLLIRTLSNFRGGVILLRNRRLIETRVLARCCFENLFAVVALGQDGIKFIQALEADHEAGRKSRAKFLLEHTSVDLNEGDEDPLRLFLRQFRDIKGRTLTPKEVAAKGPLVKAYAYYAQLSADAGHPTLDSLLGRYVSRKNEEGKEVTMVDIEPTISADESRTTLFYLCEALLGVCVWANTILENAAMEPSIQKLLDQYGTFQMDKP